MTYQVLKELALSRQEFGDLLAEFMKEFDLSLNDVERLSKGKPGISRSTVHRLQVGRTTQAAYVLALAGLEETFEKFLVEDRKLPFDLAEENYLDKLFPYRKDRENMIINRTILTAAAVKHFGLTADPFDVDRVPGDDDMFSNKELDEIAQRITDAVLYKRFIYIKGGVGTGKTSMKIRVARQLADSNHRTHLIYPEFFDMAGVNVGAIAASILDEFEVKAPHSATARVKRIKQQLTSMVKDGAKIALCFDECHRLNEKVIISLKNFWEMTNGGYERLLGVVLYGQPKFGDATLRDYKFSEIAQRIDMIEMPSISKSAADYLRHKISSVGGDIDQIFDPKSVQRICTVARTPLALGNVANYALMEAFKREETRVVSGMLTLPDAPALRGIRRAA